jgi:hypothetical protein
VATKTFSSGLDTTLMNQGGLKIHSYAPHPELTYLIPNHSKLTSVG